MKKYKVEVTRTIVYEVEIDESNYNEHAQQEFESTFWPLPDTGDPAASFAQALAEQTARMGTGVFIEGFGLVVDSKAEADLQKKFGNGCVEDMFIREESEWVDSEVREA